MNRARGKNSTTRIDWLPWSLSVFGALCAVFVLVRGVLPERAANRELVQRVERLEGDLSRARQETLAGLTRAKEQLAQQELAARAEIGIAREQERRRLAREAARRDLEQELASDIAAQNVTLLTRGDDLVVVIRERLMFYNGSSLIEQKGKRLLRELASAIHRASAAHVYRVAAQTEKQERSVVRYLEHYGRVPRARLAMAGAPPASAAGEGRAPGTVEIQLSPGEL